MPKVLVLDESTSALDSVTETKLQNAIMGEQLTLIAIAHRLRTIQGFDQIMVMEKGKIVEAGNHAELMKCETGVYRRLWNISE
jgi:ABC-type multidrug transport system fused ATPase/permease subunit